MVCAEHMKWFVVNKQLRPRYAQRLFYAKCFFPENCEQLTVKFADGGTSKKRPQGTLCFSLPISRIPCLAFDDAEQLRTYGITSLAFILAPIYHNVCK